MKDIKPLLIAMLALGLAGTWAYHLYDKTRYTKMRNTVFVKDAAAIADGVRDSLNQVFSLLEKQLDARLDSSISASDSIEKKLQGRVSEINRLKEEINGILNKQSVSRADLTLARSKIEELQESVDGLHQQNQSMEEEKVELQAMLGEISRNADSLQKNISRLNLENASLSEKISHGAYFIASEIKLSAVSIKNKRDQETGTASRADKFLVAFSIQNNINQYDNEEMYIVIIKPDKTVLRKADWSSGSFDTKKAGKQQYTRVIRFDYERGEKKDMNFTLDPDDFDQGTYTLQLWHRGMLIGQSTTTLN
ncbi:MAG: hypothetical protein EOO05_15415 [Chitinophagaceae bacterium]|nr:MAG: hypothetical protein EOO05_15415 [Chitinophagaceae bacterium]